MTNHRIYQLIIGLPKQIKEATEISDQIGEKWLKREIENVVVSGMGGSGIGGEILHNLGYKYARVPIFVVKDYTVPLLVSKETLFFAVSYSGNTEETIESYLRAKERRAAIFVITSGGRLKRLAEKYKDPLIEIPKGLPPRQAVGYLFTPLLAIAGKKKILPFSLAEIKEAGERISSFQTRCEDLAKDLAKSFYQKIPYILAGSPLYSAIAYRWRCQLNENSKTLAFFNTLPEQNHNEIEGIGRPRFFKDLLAFVLLSDPTAHPRIHLRAEVLPKILRREFYSFQKIEPFGENDIQRIFSLILVGDLTSFYLGLSYKKDIEKIERIERLKKILKP